MKRKFYTVYKTINLINGRFYIGAHATDDPNDFYMGSGSIIYQAFKKYGYRNFKKEILAIFDNPEDMFNCEIDTIAKFQGDPLLYNLDKGGKGGFHYLTQEQEQD
jgi:propanediol dehydratase small subunit